MLSVKQFIPTGKNGLEVGVGTGRFAAELGIKNGIEPAPNMAAMVIESQKGVFAKSDLIGEHQKPWGIFSPIGKLT